MVEEIVIKDIEELFDTLRLSNSAMWGETYPSDWLFRGQASENWPVLPKAWRQETLNDYSEIIEAIREKINFCKERIVNLHHEQGWPNILPDNIFEMHVLSIFQFELINEFRFYAEDLALIDPPKAWEELDEWALKSASQAWLCRYPGQKSETNLEIVSLAQHHGVPTCMIDWSLDPIKALVFATDEESNENPAIWALNRKKLKRLDAHSHRDPSTEFHVRLNLYDPPRRLNLNANSQDGVLLHMTNYDYYYNLKSEYPDLVSVIGKYCKIINRESDNFIKKIVIDKDRIKLLDIRRRLFRDRKTLAHLMPSLDNCAKTSKRSILENVKARY